MKKSILAFVFLAVTSVVLIQSCNQIDETGTIQFGLEEFIEDAQLKSATTDARPVEALVSIMDANGELVYDKETLPLYRFGDELITKSLKLRVGKFSLVEFMLTDSSGTVLWATPKEGSPLAHLVRQPLPKDFRVGANETTRLPVEVVRVGSHPPQDFGYVAFDIHFVKHFCLQVFFSTRCMEYNDSIYTLNANGSFAPVYMPRLMVWTGNQSVLDEYMAPGLNTYTLPMSQDPYHLMAIDCRMDTIFVGKFTVMELLQHRCGPDYSPLVIHNAQDSVYVTPEGLMEPDISQGVFGRITKPVPDTTMTEEYAFEGVVRDIYFFQPYTLLDSLAMVNSVINCIWPWMPSDPVFISRSNSDGYFQAPLAVGTYLYMVKVQGGFFIDLYISSHEPGMVTVNENMVTGLNIHLIDCSMWM
jgi:hypothetical protein